MLKFSGAIVWRLGSRASLRKYTNPSSTVFKIDTTESARGISDNNVSHSVTSDKEASGLVAAAFASLNAPEDAVKKPSPKSIKLNKAQQLDVQIMKAKDVESLLVVAESPIISRRHALKMVSILSDWSNENKTKLVDFERDPRFLKLCRVLARTPATQAMSSLTVAEDLSTVLGISGDDEAARLIANLSLPQMVKVMKALTQKGRRSTPLLHALSHNITKQPEVIDLKKAADLLFCMCSLNYPEPLLMDRICADILRSLPEYTGGGAAVSAVAGSLGRLRWRDARVLAALAGWWRARPPRPSDAAALLAATAHVALPPDHAGPLLQVCSSLREEDMSRAAAWLELVWALLLLQAATQRHLASVLAASFVDRLVSAGEIPISVRRKLMTIDAAAQLMDPSIPRLDREVSAGVPVVYTKAKAQYVQAILDSFKSLVSADAFLKRDCNSGMGFLYDAEFVVDDKCNPVPLEKAAKDKSYHRVAVLGLDYHDMTRKSPAPLGHMQLYARLLRAQGYKILMIPYTEFNPKDKLITRVQYIEQRLKELISGQQPPL